MFGSYLDHHKTAQVNDKLQTFRHLQSHVRGKGGIFVKVLHYSTSLLGITA